MVTAVSASFLVNTQNNAQPQGESDVALLSNGRIAVVWTDQKNGEDHSDIRGQLFDASGALIGTDFEVNASTTNAQVKASIVADTSGGFHVGWEDALTNTSIEDVAVLTEGRADMLRSYTTSASGVGAGSITEVYKYTGDFAIYDTGPSLVTLSTGALLYGHTKFDDEAIAIAAKTTGSAIVMEDPTREDFAYSFNHPEFAALEGGNFAVVADSFYEIEVEDDADAMNGIFLRLPGIANLIHVTGNPFGNQMFPHVAAATNGSVKGVFVTWYSDTSVSIKGRFVSLTGDVSGDHTIASFTDSSDYDMASLGDGRVVVVWAEDGNIKGEIVNGDGSTAEAFTVDDSAKAGTQPAVSVQGNKFVVSWTEDQGGSSSGDIRARIFSFDGGIPTITGTSGGDLIDGVTSPAGQPKATNGAEIIDALGGNDTVKALGGNDTVKGGTGNDSLDGGAGADRVEGGTGDDTFVFGTGDTLVELSGGGTDTVKSSSTFTLATNFEYLTLTGTGTANGTGNGAKNKLTGNDGKNVLKGIDGDDTLLGGKGDDTLFGGKGKDSLDGGTGKDRFVFDTALSATTNVDRIVGFKVADDTIALEKDIFKFGTVGKTIGTAAFTKGTSGKAQDSSDRIVYETDTGKLFFDKNGSASGGSIQIALLDKNLLLTEKDFLIV